MINIVDARRKMAESIATDLITNRLSPTLPEDQKLEVAIDTFETTLVMAERRGINIAVAKLENYVNILRSQMSYGPANHIEQSVKMFKNWLENSASFLLKKQLEEAIKEGIVKPEE